MCFNMLIRNKLVYTYIHYRWVHCNSNEPFHFHMKMKIIPIIVILDKLYSFPYEIISSRAYTVKMLRDAREKSTICIFNLNYKMG